MKDPLEQLREAATRFTRDAGGQAAAQPVADEHPPTPQAAAVRVAQPEPPTEAELKATAVAGTLTGRLATLATPELARLITLFSTAKPKILAADRRLIVSALDYGEAWSIHSIAALTRTLGFSLTKNAVVVLWEQLRPSRSAATIDTELQVLERVTPPGLARTVQAVLDVCRSERLTMSSDRTYQAALKLGAIPSHTPQHVMDDVGSEMEGRLAPFAVKQVLGRLGYKTDDLTVHETTLYLRKSREAGRPTTLPDDEVDLQRIAEYLGGRRPMPPAVLEAVRLAHGVVIARWQARQIAARLRSLTQDFPLGSQTVKCIRAMMARMPGLSGQDIVHRALLSSMESMADVGTPGFSPAVSDALQARMIRSRFNALDPARPVDAASVQRSKNAKKPRRREDARAGLQISSSD